MKFLAILFLLLANFSSAQTFTTGFVLETRAELLEENQDGFQRFLDRAKSFTSPTALVSSEIASLESAQSILDSAEQLVLTVVQTMPHQSNLDQAIQATLDTAAATILEELRGDIENGSIVAGVSYETIAFAVAEDLLFQLTESDLFSTEAELAIKSTASGILNIIRLKTSIAGFQSADSLSDLPLASIEVVENGYLLLKTTGVDITLSTLGIAEALPRYLELVEQSSTDSAQLAQLRYLESKARFRSLVDQLPNDWNSLPVQASEKRSLALTAAVAVSAIEQYELFTSIGLLNFRDFSLRQDWVFLIRQISEENNRDELGDIFRPLASSEQLIALAHNFLDEYRANLPPFEVTTDSLNLGEFYFGASQLTTRSITIYNQRQTTLRLRILNITPGIAVSQAWRDGVVVNPGKICTVPIGFDPTTAGHFSTTLNVVQADAPDESPRILTFTGIAVSVPALPTYRVDMSKTHRGHVDYLNEQGESLFDLPEFNDGFDHWNSAVHFKRMRNGLLLTSSNKFPQESNGELTKLSLGEDGDILSNDHFYYQGDGVFRKLSELPEGSYSVDNFLEGRPCLEWDLAGEAPWLGPDQPAIYRAYHFRPENLESFEGFELQNQVVPGVKKLAIVTHGWNPESLPSNLNNDLRSLMSDLKSFQDSFATPGAEQWSIRGYNWSEDADTGGIPLTTSDIALRREGSVNGTEAAEAGHLHGIYLGHLIKRKYPELKKIHLIAHSAGSWVARGAAKVLAEADVDLTIQVTLLDGYMPDENNEHTGGPYGLALGVARMNPNSWLPSQFRSNTTPSLAYGTMDRSIRTDSYWARGQLPISGFVWVPGTDQDITGFNSNRQVIEGDNFRDFESNAHAFPIEWYSDTVNQITSTRASFGQREFRQGTEWSNADILNQQRGFRDSIIFDDLIPRVSSLALKQPDLIPFLPITDPSQPTINPLKAIVDKTGETIVARSDFQAGSFPSSSLETFELTGENLDWIGAVELYPTGQHDSSPFVRTEILPSSTSTSLKFRILAEDYSNLDSSYYRS